MGDVYVSIPTAERNAGTETRAARWERALRERLPAGRFVIVIGDVVDGQLRLRSAQSVSGQIGDFTEPAGKIIGETAIE
jgi:hypothetical protein